MWNILGKFPLPTYPKSTSQGVCFSRYDVIELPGCFVMAKVYQRWSCSRLAHTMCETNNKIMIRRNTTRRILEIISIPLFLHPTLYGAIRFTLSGYSRSIEFSIKDSICKKMSSNCSGDGHASQHVCDRILSKDHFQQLLKARSCRQSSHASKKAHFCVNP